MKGKEIHMFHTEVPSLIAQITVTLVQGCELLPFDRVKLCSNSVAVRLFGMILSFSHR